LEPSSPRTFGAIRRLGRRLLALLIGAAAIAVLWQAGRLPSGSTLNVVVVTLDTTRADRLSPYGFMDAVMPALDRIAREGVVFDRASTVAPLTLPAHASLFTGLFPPGHGVRDNSDRPLAAGHTTLAEALRAHGFRTAAFVASSVLAPERGLAQGFDRYVAVDATEVEPAPQRRADQVIDDAIGWLDETGGGRFFLWAHLFDPHLPYDPPEPYGSLHDDPYVGEILFADAQIGRLIDYLDARRLLDRTIVVVAGDHGESLGDHGERDHGVLLYEGVMRVPLMIRAPAVQPNRVADVVRLVDVMPTVLDLVGLPHPKVDGVSLTGLMTDWQQRVDLDAYSESLYPQRFGWSSLHALRTGAFKLIDGPRPELYDLERDPFEAHNLYDARRDLAEAMTARLRALAKGRADEAADADFLPPARLREHLSALGYVGSSRAAARTPVPGQALPDPKDCITRPASAPCRPGGPRAASPSIR
jgi:arylsulfatase A-like enzyme